MIKIQELNSENFPLDSEQQKNILILLERMNQFRAAYGHPMFITSGVRTLTHHLEIYRKMNEQRVKDKLLPLSVPMASLHLKAAACDVSDPNGSLLAYCKANEKLLEQCELWIEDDTTQKRVHFQIYPPKSGNRFFKP